jgi:hypothetical protein
MRRLDAFDDARGLPATSDPAGTSRATTLAAATMQLSPIVTPGGG